MTEEKVDRVLTAWARDYVAGKSLPEGFSERLRLSVRRSRRAFKVRLTILIALIAATVTLAIGMTGRTTPPSDRKAAPPSDRKAALIAANGAAKEECVTGWALLSMFRECFRRGKSGKKKEDE